MYRKLFLTGAVILVVIIFSLVVTIKDLSAPEAPDIPLIVEVRNDYEFLKIFSSQEECEEITGEVCGIDAEEQWAPSGEPLIDEFLEQPSFPVPEGFKGPTAPPSVKGPTSPPPSY